MWLKMELEWKETLPRRVWPARSPNLIPRPRQYSFHTPAVQYPRSRPPQHKGGDRAVSSCEHDPKIHRQVNFVTNHVCHIHRQTRGKRQFLNNFNSNHALIRYATYHLGESKIEVKKFPIIAADFRSCKTSCKKSCSARMWSFHSWGNILSWKS